MHTGSALVRWVGCDYPVSHYELLPSKLFLCCYFRKQVTGCTNTQEWRITLGYVKDKAATHMICNYFEWKSCIFSSTKIYLSPLMLYLYWYDQLFYILDHIPIQNCWFGCFNCFSFGDWKSFTWLYCLVLRSFHFLENIKSQGSLCIFTIPSIEFFFKSI